MYYAVIGDLDNFPNLISRKQNRSKPYINIDKLVTKTDLYKPSLSVFPMERSALVDNVSWGLKWRLQ